MTEGGFVTGPSIGSADAGHLSQTLSRMKPANLALTLQVALLAYHQITTYVDLFPFNGARFYSRRERVIEMCVNLVLMGGAIVCTILGSATLTLCAAVYYFVLFTLELIVWWVPYLVTPTGVWRRIYNALLAVGTSDFEAGDQLARWQAIYERLHTKTITVLRRRQGRITPNLEHTVLHLATLVTAVITFRVYLNL